jgi:hypothetical protein
MWGLSISASATTSSQREMIPAYAIIKKAKGFDLAMIKIGFTGEVDDVRDTVMANWRNMI